MLSDSIFQPGAIEEFLQLLVDKEYNYMQELRQKVGREDYCRGKLDAISDLQATLHNKRALHRNSNKDKEEN